MLRKYKIIFIIIISVIMILFCCDLVSCVEYSVSKIYIEGWNYCFDEKSEKSFTETEMLLLESKGCYILEKDRYHNAGQTVRIKNYKSLYDKLKISDDYVMELTSNSFMNKDGDTAVFFFKNNSYYYVQRIPLYRNTKYKNLFIFTACYAVYDCGLYSLIFPHIDGYYADNYNYQYVDYSWNFLEKYYGRFNEYVTIDAIEKTILITPIKVSNNLAYGQSYEKIKLTWSKDEYGNKIIFNVI